jgi:hypothetical protein
MKLAIEKENVLPNVMIRDVLVANPQASKSSEILDKVNERIDPMPEEMLGEILEGRTFKGQLELLEEKLASHQNVKYASLHKLESFFKQDTSDYQNVQDSLISILETEFVPSILYRLAFLYLDKGDSLSCFNTLNSIPGLNDLTPEEYAEFNLYSELLNLIWPLRKVTFMIDSLIASQLFAMAESDLIPGIIARNILLAHGLTEYNEPIILSGLLKSSLIIPSKTNPYTDTDHLITIYPNPARDYFIISYDLTGINGSFQVNIIDTDGKKLYQEKFTGVENQMVVSTEGFPSSLYELQLLNNGRIIESLKFIVIK